MVGGKGAQGDDARRRPGHARAAGRRRIHRRVDIVQRLKNDVQAGLSPLSGLFIENVRYPLRDFALPFGSSRTISNVAEGPIRLSLASGRAILIARPYDLSGA